MRIDSTDDPALYGAFCVSLTKAPQEMSWLTGRFLSAEWDADELIGMKESIVKKNIFKAGMTIA